MTIFFKNRSRRFAYMLPFFLLIIFGILAVIVGSILFKVFVEEKALVDKEVVFFSDSSMADLLSWGSSKWRQIASGTQVKEGDTITSAAGSRSVVSFQRKNFFRLDERSTFVLNLQEKKNKSAATTKLGLFSGRFWLDWRYDRETKLELDMDSLFLETTNALVDIDVKENGRTVRVLDGTISLKMLDKSEGRIRLLDREDISAGFQIFIGDEEIEMLKRSLSSDFIAVIPEEYLYDSWYAWNKDTKSDFLFNGEKSSFVQANLNQAQILESGISKGPELKIDYPENGDTLNVNHLVLAGSVSGEVDFIEVYATYDRRTDYFRLKQFKKGDTEFSYSASFKLGNLAKGMNIFRVLATSLAERVTVVAEVSVKIK